MSEVSSIPLDRIKSRDPDQVEFHQAVEEALTSLALVVEKHPEYSRARIIERMIEPERVIIFRVPWMDDAGDIQVNRGTRVEMNGAIGPFKGGLRFHPSVNLSILKFLAFEQVFKNSLTTLPLGGGKGGADFNPKGRSENEIMRFCQSFMSELFRHIGPDTDVPAGDIGVGKREIGYLFGQFRKLKNQFAGVLTGKGLDWGGSLVREEATGFGVVYFAAEMLKTKTDTLDGKTCLVSGSGNVAQHTVEMLIQLGSKVFTMSDSSGCVFDPEGIGPEKLAFIRELKNKNRGRIGEYAEAFKEAVYTPFDPELDYNPLWTYKADCAFPCATQNEINALDARNLLDNGCIMVIEGANMPTEQRAVHLLQEAGILFGPGKAANAGGVAVSGLEMSQNSLRMGWTRKEVCRRLQSIMKTIHQNCYEAAESYGVSGNYVHGANIAGFRKVANAMLEQGLI